MDAADPCLSQALGHGRYLRARCRCQRTAVIAAAQWAAEGLADQRLSRLSDRLRCLCGARSASLEIVNGEPDPAQAASRAIYRFR